MFAHCPQYWVLLRTQSTWTKYWGHHCIFGYTATQNYWPPNIQYVWPHCSSSRKEDPCVMSKEVLSLVRITFPEGSSEPSPHCMPCRCLLCAFWYAAAFRRAVCIGNVGWSAAATAVTVQPYSKAHSCRISVDNRECGASNSNIWNARCKPFILGIRKTWKLNNGWSRTMEVASLARSKQTVW